MRFFKPLGIVALSLSCTLLQNPAFANKTVDAPYAEGGAAYLEWKGGYDYDDRDDIDGGWVQEGNAGYGITDWWNFEVGTAFEHEGIKDGNTDLTTIVIENRFNILPQGKYFIDFGVAAAYAIATKSDAADAIEGKFIFAKETGNFTHLANVIVGREVGSNAPDDTDTTYGFAWGTSYSYSENFAGGLEWYSDFGNFDGDYDEQSHQFGPAVYGDLGNGFAVETGALFGVSDGAQDVQLKAVINYSFPVAF